MTNPVHFSAKPVVYVVDDNQGSCKFFSSLLCTLDVLVKTFRSAEEFLETYENRGPACLVLDLALPGISGLELQAELQQRNITVPVIVVTGYSDVSSAVQCMKAGAVDYFEKPIQNHAFLDSVRKALHSCIENLENTREKALISKEMGQLTQRETEVLELIVDGLQNKDIAQKLLISVKTVEVHRGNVMKKMHCSSIAHLVRKYLKARE